MTGKAEHRSIMVIAGEESGDARGAEVINALRDIDPDVTWFGVGGDRMAGLGVDCIYHMRDMAFLGFFEVIHHLPFILKVYRRLLRELRTRKPDLILLIDYPGFNLRFAKRAKKLGFTTAYFVSPQVWAWGSNRVKKMAGVIDRMHVIFPFEEALYAQSGIDVRFVGHPLVASCRPDSDRSTFLKREELDDSLPIIGLLPGSRRQEVQRLLPEMAAAARLMNRDSSGLQFITGKAPAMDDALYRELAPDLKTTAHTHDIMAFADIVLVASGTATLETALFQTPMIICYKMAPVSYLIGRLLVTVPHIGLANIVAGEGIVPELIQRQAAAPVMAAKLRELLAHTPLLRRIRASLAKVAERLGSPGAAVRVAESLKELMDRE